jgi:hypothetical protein
MYFIFIDIINSYIIDFGGNRLESYDRSDTDPDEGNINSKDEITSFGYVFIPYSCPVCGYQAKNNEPKTSVGLFRCPKCDYPIEAEALFERLISFDVDIDEYIKIAFPDGNINK